MAPSWVLQSPRDHFLAELAFKAIALLSPPKKNTEVI